MILDASPHIALLAGARPGDYMANQVALIPARVSCLFFVAGLLLGHQAQLEADDATVADYRSERVVLHTDLPAEKAKTWLAELEKVLDFAANHWKRPSRGLIECYIVDDLPKWPGTLHERARKAIEAGSGVTLTE